MTTYVDVPYASLTKDALEALVEEFITREGTDYGQEEHSLNEKVTHVMRQLERQEVAIVFDPDTESVTLVRRDQLVPP